LSLAVKVHFWGTLLVPVRSRINIVGYLFLGSISVQSTTTGCILGERVGVREFCIKHASFFAFRSK
jgi:hypothetical protein